MKQRYLFQLGWKLFRKYVLILFALCIGGAFILYLFNNVLNGVIIDFIRLLSWTSDPFDTFTRMFSILLPAVVVLTAFFLVYFLCKDLAHYMKILVEGIDDILAKERVNVHFPKEMAHTETLLMEISDEYRRYQKAAENDENRKKDLIYLLAQDIKMPLSNILMYLDFLSKEQRISPEIRNDFIVQILYKALDLEDMINEFFDITRFNLQYAKWNPEMMFLDRMVEQVVDESYILMEDKHIKVELHYEHQLSLHADSDKIARVMRDLLRNMMTLAYDDSSLDISMQQHEAHYNMILQVAAPHLSAYQIAHLFHNFYRLEDMHGDGKQHILGLGVARQIIDMHKGSLRAASIGEELSFYIDLPVQSGYIVLSEEQ